LEEIESRVEAYPETRAFMKLLASLTQYPVPANLGAGYRVPGFEPYLDFLRDSVLLKFKARAYLDPNEKVHYITLHLALCPGYDKLIVTNCFIFLVLF
jgi:nuclear pore complex protein Nup205